MADQVEEIKQKTDLVSLIGEYVELKKAGRNYKALCPFHSEKTPSFYVSSELQIFKCFGCGESGDAFTFLQKYEGMDFPEALKFLAEKVGVKLKPTSFGQKSDKEKFYQINSLAARFYNYILLNHTAGKIALEYLRSVRGLELDTIKAFNLGYSPDVPFALKKFLVDKKKVALSDIERVGLIYQREGKVFDRFRGRVTFPLSDHRGNIVGFSGRILPKENSDLAKYINTPETEIYHKGSVLYALEINKGEIKKKDQAIVVEGELDAISSWQAGIKNVVAIKGSAFTEDQVRLLERFTKNLVLCLDADFAGDVAARRGITIAQRYGLEIRVAKLRGFKDPDEVARHNPEKLKLFIDKAPGVWDFIIGSILSRYTTDSGIDLGKISREVVPVLSSIEDKIVQAHYINLVARKLNIPEESVASQIQAVAKKGGEEKGRVESLAKVTKKDRQEILEERLMSLIFRFDPSLILDIELKSLIKTRKFVRILEEFKKFYKKDIDFDPSAFAGKLPGELVDGFTELILKEIGKLDESSSFQKEFTLVKKELKIIKLKNRLKEIGKIISTSEAKSEKPKLKKVKGEFDLLTKTLLKLEDAKFRGIMAR